MPEGPEIRRVAQRLSRALVGEPLIAVVLDVEGLEGWAERLLGAQVTAVRSRGKALLTSFSTGHVLYSHNLLYGRWSVVRGEPRPSRRRLRVMLRTEKLTALLHSATEFAWVAEADVDTIPYLRRLGPDILDLSQAELRSRLREPAFRRRQLAALLLDQAFVAGLGNYLRAEALFVARISPAKRPCDLDAREVRALCAAIGELGARSVVTGGTTLDARRVARAKAAKQPRRDARHFVYGRAGRPCFRCESPIVRADLGGRHLFACPHCQGWPPRLDESPPS